MMAVFVCVPHCSNIDQQSAVGAMAMQYTDMHQHGLLQYPYNPSSHRQSYYGSDYEMAIRLPLSLSDRHPSRDR